MREAFLTDDQRLIVENNMNIARYFFKKYRAPIGVEKDDWFQEILCSLCYAVSWHDPNKGTLGTLLASVLVSRWKDLRVRSERHQNIMSIYQKCGEDGAVLADLLESGSLPTGDAIEEVNSIISAFPEEWQVACRNAINPKVCSKEDADTVNEIRSGFRLRGRASYCVHCSTVFIGSENGTAKYCRECKLINRRFLDREQKRKRRDRIISSRSQAI